MKFLICIAFNYNADRLPYLQQVMYQHQFLASEVEIVINTNTCDVDEINSIRSVAPMQNPQAKVVVEIYAGLPNPWLLTWAHKVSFAKRLPDTSFTHFMYTEDDLEVTPINIDFWLSARELLRPFGLYPSFFSGRMARAKSVLGKL